MSATDLTGLYIDGETNDYAGAGVTGTVVMKRDIAQAALSNHTGWSNYVTLKHAAGQTDTINYVYGNINRIDNNSTIINNTADNDVYHEYGTYSWIDAKGGVYDLQAAGNMELVVTGVESYVETTDLGSTARLDLSDTGAGGGVGSMEVTGYHARMFHGPDVLSGAWTMTATGFDATIRSEPLLTGGTIIQNTNGLLVNIDASDVGTSVAKGINIAAVAGADTNWAIHSATVAPSHFAGSLEAATITYGGAEVYRVGGTDVADADVVDALTISGGTVNGSVVGGVTPAAGTFTTLGATSAGQHYIGGSAEAGAAVTIAGSFDATGTNASATILNVGGTANTKASYNAYGVYIHPTLTEAASGNHVIMAGTRFNQPAITVGAATVTDAVSVYISGAPSATVTGKNYSFWVDLGETRLDNLVTMPQVYAHNMNGETIRALQINDTGELGYDSSSARFKTNIVPMEDTSWIYDLRPVNYEPRKKIMVEDKQVYTSESTGVKRYGLIAEEVEKVNPTFVFYDDENRVTGVHYGDLISPLVNEVQRLKSRVDELEKRLTALESK
jgi:hypothetical protein